MRYNSIKQSVLAQFNAPQGNQIVPFILGAPGGGKSACARDIVRTWKEDFEAPVVEFTASLRDPVDVMGVPITTGDYTRWLPPEEFYSLRQGVGPCALILEELSDATLPMQNALCGVIYDRRAGQLQLSDELIIIATGNRTEDKSGANRISSKLAGRTRRFDFTENLEDWTQWALAANLPTELIQFLRFKPALLSDFDPSRFANPTPRTWEKVGLIPPTMPDHLLYDTVCGDVGEGAATEYLAFKKIFGQLPNIDALLLDPARAEVPTEPSVLFAITGALARKTTVNNFDRVCAYIKRLPPEFSVMTVKDALSLTNGIRHTRAFSEWASANADVLM